MKGIPLQPTDARAFAHRAGACKDLVGTAVAKFGQTGEPVTTYRVLHCVEGPDRPPRGLVLVFFSIGSAVEADNGWNGMLFAPVSNQRDLNLARHMITELTSSLGHLWDGAMQDLDDSTP